MKLFEYKPLYNFVLFQSIWFIAVLGRADWSLVLVVLLAVHIFATKNKIAELAMMISGASIGVFVDSILTVNGVYSFGPEPSLLPVPFWLVAIWLGFCGTLRHSMRFITNYPLIMVFAAGIAAPLTYFAAMRLGAVEFPMEIMDTAIIIGLSWIAVMSLLHFINKFIKQYEAKYLSAN